MELQEILSTLKQHKSHIKENYSVDQIGVFGSYAKGTATPESDIDFYVVFKDKTVDNITQLWLYLETLFNKKVDLLHYHKRLREGLKQQLDKEVIYG